MSLTNQPDSPSTQSLTRETFVSLVHAALSVNRYRFAREATLKWLAAYPGDLTIGLYYAKALLGESQTQLAVRILEGLCKADPEFMDAAQALYALQRQARMKSAPDSRQLGIETLAYLYALLGKLPSDATIPAWGKDLRLARLAISKGEFEVAKEITRQVISSDPPSPLAAATHLQLLAQRGGQPTQEAQQIAIQYHQRWPDCLVCKLILADWLMEGSDSGQAVALLHQAASRDVSGQVARRLWGEDHQYRSMWLERLDLDFDIPVPADVAAYLGWNRLPENTSLASTKTVGEYAQMDEIFSPPGVSGESQLVDNGLDADPGSKDVSAAYDDLDWLDLAGELPLVEELPEESTAETIDKILETLTQQEQDGPPQEESSPESLVEIQEELDRIASRLRMPGKMPLDGRYPVYVVFSLRQRLEAVFGAQVAGILVAEMRRIVQSLAGKKGWSAMLFLPDDPASGDHLGITLDKPDDPWAVKLAIADLDSKLADQGEMIGSLLIVGGPEIVPFHQLPNPVDDQDLDVSSDNPYSTRDTNYFVPEWPVGRIPCGSDLDAKFLLSCLRRLSLNHTEGKRRTPWFLRWFQALKGWFSRNGAQHNNLGYSAAVWRDAASKVFRQIGEPKRMYVSPPSGINGSHGDDFLDELDFEDLLGENIPKLKGLLGYFNLHGLVDAAEWFGQRHPLDLEGGVDYPVALRPQDIDIQGRGKGPMPKVIFSEACFGSHLEGRDTQDSIALKFLEAGAQAFIGSTCMAYGSVDEELIAADLLGYHFWRLVKEGFSAGEALRLAKIRLASEMHQRQGYLDGEDQKTLISFVYYGDPLAQPMEARYHHKGITRNKEASSQVKTVCDRILDEPASQVVPQEVMSTVRQVVSQYLPGMTGASVTFSMERERCRGEGHVCPTSQFNRASPNEGGDLSESGDPSINETSGQAKPRRSLVTLSKQVPGRKGNHPYYARLTLEEGGKLVKLVVSR